MTAKELIAVAEDHAKCGSIRSALVNLIQAVAKLEDRIATPTIKESLTVAPDPGPGWRLIDKEKDHPQEGDEVWIRQWHHWYKRGYQFQMAPFAEGYHYRRRIEAATPNVADATPNVAELPAGLPPLPEGAVYLGKGGTFNAPRGLFQAWKYCRHESDGWLGLRLYAGNTKEGHFAAPADSEVARLNGLGVEPAANVEGHWSKAIRIDALEQQINALTKERDEIFGHLCKERREFSAEQQRLAKERDEAREALAATIAAKEHTIATLKDCARDWQSKYEQLRAACMAFNNVIHMTNAAKKEEVSNG